MIKLLKRKNIKKREILLVIISILMITVLSFLPTGFQTNEYPGSSRVKVEILGVDNSSVYSAGGVILQGAQICQVRITEGGFKGTEMPAENLYIGKLEIDKVFVEGDMALAVIDHDIDKVNHITLVDHYRLDLEFYLVIAFFLLLVFFAGWSGFKAFLTFLLSVFLIWKLMVPLYLKGHPPVIVAFAVVVFLTVAIILMVAGFNKKSLVAIVGSLSGSLLTCVLAIIFGHAFKIHGAVLPYSEMLLYSGYANLNLTDIFISSIFIASAGALMDLAMDISAAIHELVEKNPGLSRIEAIRSGFTIGRSVVGTMTTTLLLAYSGSYIALLMVFMAQGTPVINILNLKYVSKEILHTIIGSFGLVTVAPFTAVLAGFIMTKPKNAKEIAAEEDKLLSAYFEADCE